MMLRHGLSVLALATLCSVLLVSCDKPANVPSVDSSKAQADHAASSAMDEARAAAVNTGEALKDTAIAAKHEAEAAVAKAQQASSSADVPGAVQRIGDDAKHAIDVAADKTHDLVQDAKSQNTPAQNGQH